MTLKRVIIVGGVAGGASAAARLRRLREDLEIVVLERGPHVSFANCGLPYYVGGEIEAEEDLLLQTPESLRARFNLDVRVLSEVTRLDPGARVVTVRDLQRGETYTLPYDALILATGAAPLRPPIPGIEREGHFTVRSVPDTADILAWIEARDARRAVVVGGGYIGLEMAEQLHRRGLSVTLAEALPQVMAPLDPEMAAWLHDELKAHDIPLHLSDGVAAFEAPRPDEHAAASVVVLKSGARLPADLVVLGLGVRPEIALARDAGLDIGERGGVRVDAEMRTSAPDVFAVGDVVEVRNAVTGEWSLIPLAGPANRQGRIAADVIAGRASRYEGTWGTAVLRLFSRTAACVGANEKALRFARIPYQAIHLHPQSHAGYFPGAEPMAFKLLFSPEEGRLLGAQAVGGEGTDKRIDVVATALQAGLTVDDLAQLELAYAPPYGSAKDPVNLAGMAAQNLLNGDVEVVQWNDLAALDADGALLLDVRSDTEQETGAIPGSVRIPLPELRSRLAELPRDREVVVYCLSGQRSYFAARLLSQHGYRVKNLTGAYRTWATATDAAKSVKG